MGGMSDFPYDFNPKASKPVPAPMRVEPPAPEQRPATRGDIAEVVSELKAIRELLEKLVAKG